MNKSLPIIQSILVKISKFLLKNLYPMKLELLIKSLIKFSVKINFYAHVHTCSPSYTDEE